MSLTIAVVHPDLLGTYGDGGNGIVLAQRARWRGIDATLVQARSDTPLPAADLYCLGGGEDGAQAASAERLRTEGVLSRAVAGGAVVLAVCAGYQIIGRTFAATDGRPLPGVGLLDVSTAKASGRRAVGEVLAEPLGEPLGEPFAASRAGNFPNGRSPVRALLTGFENHGGVTTLGARAAPLARVLAGIGNGDGTDGAVEGRVVGTYLHGPVLARNPALADLLLSWAVGRTLGPLGDTEEEALREERIAAVRHRTGAGLLVRALRYVGGRS